MDEFRHSGPTYSIGNYDIYEQIGSGGFSVVRRARQKDSKITYACKIVPHQCLSKERFKREISIMQSLEHQNIVQLYDLLHDDNNFFIIEEYCPYGSLFNLIEKRGQLSIDECKSIFRQILTGMAYIHGNGYAHRDIKPENILFGEGNCAKISDFGLSARSDSSILLSTHCGSFFYTAPEINSGAPYDGQKADIWSLGVTLYVMFLGKFPFSHRTNVASLEQRHLDRKIKKKISNKDLNNIIRRMMQLDPGKRPTVMELCDDPFVQGIELFNLTKQMKHRHINEEDIDKIFERRRKSQTSISQKYLLKLPVLHQSGLNLLNPMVQGVVNFRHRKASQPFVCPPTTFRERLLMADSIDPVLHSLTTRVGEKM